MKRSCSWVKRFLVLAPMLVLVFAPDLRAQTEIINSVAGNGVMGFGGDGTIAVSAELSVPTAVAVDKAGNLFIADMANNRVRRVDQATRIISTVAGNGTAGYSGTTGTGVCPNNGGSEPGDGGLAKDACLYNPTGVAIDKTGNIYIADFGNRRIRKVSTGGTITTVAGGGTTCPGDGLVATSACLIGPNGIAVDGSGNVYISDVTDARVRKVAASDQTISTVAGNGVTGYSGDGGPAMGARLWAPRGIALDSSGNLYIADSGNERVRKVAASTGTIVTIAGNGIQGYSGAGCPANGGLEPGDGGRATAACLSIPSGLAITAGKIYIADTFNNRIRVIQNGIINTVAGGTLGGGFLYCGDGKPALNACLYHPTGVAVVGSISTSNIYIADSLNSRIRYAFPGICSATSCSAIPINYRQVGPGADIGGGVLFFNYAWDSSDGNLADLGNCTIGELVTYPGTANPYVYASPPYAVGDTSPNPTIKWGTATAAKGTGTDTHSPKPFAKTYVFNTFTAGQNYRYTCLGLPPVNFPGWIGIQINRTVQFNSAVGCWMYTVTKSGYSASECLP